MHEIQIHNGFNILPFTLRRAAYFVPISISSRCWNVDTRISMEFLKQLQRYVFKCLHLARQAIRNYKATIINLEHTDPLIDCLEVIYKKFNITMKSRRVFVYMTLTKTFHIRSLGTFNICGNNIQSLCYMSSYNGLINFLYQVQKKKECRSHTIFCILHKNHLRKHDVLFIDNQSNHRKFRAL